MFQFVFNYHLLLARKNILLSTGRSEALGIRGLDEEVNSQRISECVKRANKARDFIVELIRDVCGRAHVYMKKYNNSLRI